MKDLFTVIKYAALPALVIVFALWWNHAPKPSWQGYAVREAPLQDFENLPLPFKYKDCYITPLANYSVTGVVVGTKRYRFDRSSFMSPIDIAVVWKKLSAADVLNQMKFKQNTRFCWYKPRNDHYPVQEKEIETSMSNNHCIPSSKEIKKQLFSVKKYEVVTLEGYLVEVNSDNFSWRSSLTRDDTGPGACELIWVTKVTRSAPKGIPASRA